MVMVIWCSASGSEAQKIVFDRYHATRYVKKGAAG